MSNFSDRAPRNLTKPSLTVEERDKMTALYKTMDVDDLKEILRSRGRVGEGDGPREVAINSLLEKMIAGKTGQGRAL